MVDSGFASRVAVLADAQVCRLIPGLPVQNSQHVHSLLCRFFVAPVQHAMHVLLERLRQLTESLIVHHVLGTALVSGFARKKP